MVNNTRVDVFLDHDVFQLPYSFVKRLGELASGEFIGESISHSNRVREIVYEAGEYI